MLGNPVQQSSLKTNLPHELFRRDEDASWLNNTCITNTKETSPKLSIKAPYVTLQFLCDSGLLQCHSCIKNVLVLVDLVLQH